jgi:uncharacterized membrane protein YfcA
MSDLMNVAFATIVVGLMLGTIVTITYAAFLLVPVLAVIGLIVIVYSIITKKQSSSKKRKRRRRY